MEKRRGLLLDRDGVVNVDQGYVGSRDRFVFLPGLFPFLRAAQDMGYRLAILTNQSGVAQGLYTVAAYEDLTGWMLEALRRQGIGVDLVLACFEHAGGTVPAYARESFWRKPNPGMVLEAVQRLSLDPARSAFLGDQRRDLEAARGGGIRQRLLLDALGGQADSDGIEIVRGYDAALAALRRNFTPLAGTPSGTSSRSA